MEPLPNKNMTHKIISAFQGLAFQEEGMYNIVLALEGEDAAALPFQVIQLTPDAVC